MRCCKKQLRQQMLAHRRKLAAVEVRRFSKAVCQSLLRLPEILAVPLLAVYAAIDNEIDVEPFVLECQRQGKKVMFPRYCPLRKQYEMVRVNAVETELTVGKYGIREPHQSLVAVELQQVDPADLAWLVPGVAFDRHGYRLGRGGGIYDRLLAQWQGRKIGVAYTWQLCSSVPVASHDVRMDIIVTESELVRAATAPTAAVAALA